MPMIYVLLICLALKIGLIVCLTCTDVVTSAACPSFPSCRFNWRKIFGFESRENQEEADDGSENANWSERNSIQYDNYIISDVIGFENGAETLSAISEAEKMAQICVCSSKKASREA